MTKRALEFLRLQHAAQARRRAEIARWVERLDALRAVTPRDDAEAASQRAAIDAHLADYPRD